MNARLRAGLDVFLSSLLGISAIAVAQQTLPAMMTGTWYATNVQASSGRYNPTGGTWSVVIDKQNRFW